MPLTKAIYIETALKRNLIRLEKGLTAYSFDCSRSSVFNGNTVALFSSDCCVVDGTGLEIKPGLVADIIYKFASRAKGLLCMSLSTVISANLSYRIRGTLLNFTKHFVSPCAVSLQSYYQQSFVDGSPTLRWCPYPNCGNVVQYVGGGAAQIPCTCGHVFCFSCGNDGHVPGTFPLSLRMQLEPNPFCTLKKSSLPCQKISKVHISGLGHQDRFKPRLCVHALAT